MRAFIVVPLTLLWILTSCGGPGHQDSDPQLLYKEAEQDIKNDQYLLALDKLRGLRNKFPYSSLASEASLRIADVYFLQESYGEAAVAYESFRDMHPKHAKAPYASFRLAESYTLDVPSNIAKDLSSAKKAEAAWDEFLKRFPQDALTEKARSMRMEVREKQASKELYIAKFYVRSDQWEAAKRRAQRLMTQYPDSRQMGDIRSILERAEKEILHKNKRP